MALYSFFILTSLIFVPVHATNDWSKPCFYGECEYSLPTDVPASGSLKIWGSADALSDITPAAGWEILDCSADGLEQEIRLICLDNNTDSTGCDHLYQSNGAVDKIVRLPESCGENAFARVARAWDPEDQSLPSDVAARVVRRDGTTPPVKALALDTNFAAINSSKLGTVNFTIVGTNIPGADIDLSSVSGSLRRSRLSSRDTSGNILSFLEDLLGIPVSVDPSFDISVDVDQTFNLLNESVSCQSINASLDINVTAKAHALATLGVSVNGTIIPPEIDDFEIIANLDATLDSAIDILADVTGTLDSGRIVLLQIPISGIDFPGIFSVGPSFEIDAEAKAELDANLDLSVGVVYNISQAQFIYPPDGGNTTSSGSFNAGDTPLKLSVGTAVNATGMIEAHLIPRLNLGVSAFADEVTATVFLELDASATLDLEIDGAAEANATIGDGSTSTDVSSDMLTTSELTSTGAAVGIAAAESSSAIDSDSQLSSVDTPSSSPPDMTTSLDPTTSSALIVPTSSVDSSTVTSISTLSTETTAVSDTLNRKRRIQATPTAEAVYAARSAAARSVSATDTGVSTNTSTSGGGCVSVYLGFDVNIGAEGNLFDIIKGSVTDTLFSKDFELFEKCFGSRTGETATLRRRDRIASRSMLDLLCSTSDLSQVTPIVDEDISASG
ncbi:uncharacterized protein BT62DRAFT_937177 [Guyanagaster necrorhizus]|uniref:DUF7223 domain-containing protein n=1 Tax=Guyanagaster necrorhizus TaxID=856835 RepID=A0A9P8AMM7_9AGAR|nr:uncharacterized protein BT62DRAFT_937177 [Guyanagaster necrorhizus MCA 3950]KAG7441408.1 hypothetical protein BT62DRAFT_937177 [Guyanagaster necrorhizus MCA 3950]